MAASARNLSAPSLFTSLGCSTVLLVLVTTMPSAAARCTKLCVSTVTSLRRNGASEELENALEALKGDLDGTSAELDEAIVAALNLRKTSMAILTKNTWSDHSVIMCSIVFQIAHLLPRYLGNPQQHQSNGLNQRFLERLKIAKQAAMPLVRSVAHLAKMREVHTKFSWRAIDQALQDCAMLGICLDSAKDDSDIVSESQSDYLVHVDLSNAYWSLFVFSKQQEGSIGLLLSILQQSILAVNERPAFERAQAFLSAKLEQLGILLERSGKNQDAMQSYQKAVENEIECGSLKTKFGIPERSSTAQILSMNDLSSTLVRYVASHVRSASRLEDETPERDTYMTLNEVGLEEGGILLEAQLRALVDQASAPNAVSQSHKRIEKLSKSLLEIYDVDTFPLRRLRVVFEVLRFHFSCPSVFGDAWISRLLDGSITNLGRDQGLEQFRECYKARATLLSVLVSRNFSYTGFSAALQAWSDFVKQVPLVGGDPSARIDDIVRCIRELEVAADLTQMKGLDDDRASTLDLLATICGYRTEVDPDMYCSKETELGLHFVRNGLLRKAAAKFQKIQLVVEKHKVSKSVHFGFHLANTEYYTEIGDEERSRQHLEQATAAFRAISDLESAKGDVKSKKFRLYWMASEWLNVLSMHSAAFGTSVNALYLQSRCVRLTWALWTMTTKQTSASKARTSTLRLWSLAPRLFARLMRLAELLSHTGLYLEAQYYLDEAAKIAVSVDAKPLAYQAEILLARFEIMRGEIDDGMSRLGRIQKEVEALGLPSLSASHLIVLSKGHGAREEKILETRALEHARDVVAQHQRKDASDARPIERDAVSDLISKTNNLSLDTTKRSKTKAALQSITAAAVKKTRASKPATAAKPKKQLKKSNEDAEGAQRASSTPNVARRLSAHISRLLAASLSKQHSFEDAERLLEQASHPTMTHPDGVLQSYTFAEILVGQTLMTYSSSPVFSLLKESTTSYPSIARLAQQGIAKVAGDTTVIKGRPPSKQARSKTAKAEGPSNASEAALTQELLNKCFETLTSVHRKWQSAASVSFLHKMADLLAKAAMMLSVAGPTEYKNSPSATFIAYAMEVGRSLAVLREGSAITTESLTAQDQDWPSALDIDAHLAKLPHVSIDPAMFQKEYIDILPDCWNVVSISISENHEELRLLKLRAAQPPFVLSIPLSRDSSQNPGEEAFGFHQCMSELSSFRDLANFSTARPNGSSEEAVRKAWWDARSALDTRLQDLVTSVENIWLGGFRGIFLQQSPPRDLLSRFQRSFYNTLEKHLPSRRKRGKGPKAKPMTFDPRVLELFVGLGHPRESLDIENTLTDLLYFVVDILQFHGERNAYDEVDFDAIVVEIIDALSSYHTALRPDSSNQPDHHTVLILDKSLHSFPWEAMPCLTSHAVSRLPSLVSLRSRILLQQQQALGSSAPPHKGLHVDPTDGTYILNPAEDLKHTEATIGPPLSELPPSWTSFIRQAPTEQDITNSLSTHSIYLYFGHGSGAQYVKARRIRRLENCAVALLMGCSSGAVTAAGEFESYGTPLNYLHGGAPAVVGTLWDVTDKDIDRFSVRCLEKWGLFGEKQKNDGRSRSVSPVKRAVSKGRGKASLKANVETLENDHRGVGMSLDRAVADAREACILRYLNGAAPVVYGIPVYLKSPS